MNIEFETPMRKFYSREQKAPISKSQIRKIKRALDSDLIASPNSPNFPAGSLRDYQWDGVRWLLFNWNQKRNSILAVS
jgi:SNF2 family DNA or RNA helicase